MAADSTLPIESSHKDLFGFIRSRKYLLEEKKRHNCTLKWVMQRDLEWVEYLKSIGGPDNLKPAGVFEPNPMLRFLVRRGIPVAFRPLVWQHISLSSFHRKAYPVDYFKILVANTGAPDPSIAQEIEKDLDRTFPGHDYFNGQTSGGMIGLRNVLRAFAIHNPHVGYCQSLNFLAGTMLLFMDEEDAFWLLVTVVERLFPEDYFSRSMLSAHVDQHVFAHIVQTRLPRVHRAMQEAGIDAPLMFIQWFLCVYINTLPPETALRVWDVFLNEGSVVLFRVAAALLKLHEKDITQCTEPSALYTVLLGIGKDFMNGDKLMNTAFRDESSSSSFSSPFYSATNSPKAVRSMSLPGEPLQGFGLAHRGPSQTTSSSSCDDHSASSYIFSTKDSSLVTSRRRERGDWVGLSPQSRKTVSLMFGYILQKTPPPQPQPHQDVSSSSCSPGGTLASDDGHARDTPKRGQVVVEVDEEKLPQLDLDLVSPSASQTKDKKPSGKRQGHKKRGEQSGDLPHRNFTAEDIGRWRKMFRGGLEKQFVEMETSRLRMLKIHTFAVSADGVKQSSQTQQSQTDIGTADDVAVSQQRHDEDEDEEGRRDMYSGYL